MPPGSGKHQVKLRAYSHNYAGSSAGRKSSRFFEFRTVANTGCPHLGERSDLRILRGTDSVARLGPICRQDFDAEGSWLHMRGRPESPGLSKRTLTRHRAFTRHADGECLTLANDLTVRTGSADRSFTRRCERVFTSLRHAPVGQSLAVDTSTLATLLMAAVPVPGLEPARPWKTSNSVTLFSQIGCRSLKWPDTSRLANCVYSWPTTVKRGHLSWKMAKYCGTSHVGVSQRPRSPSRRPQC